MALAANNSASMHDKNAMVPGPESNRHAFLSFGFNLQGDADRAQGVNGQVLDKFQ